METTDSGYTQHRDDPIYDRLQESPDFVELRKRYRGFVIPATVAFLSWYLLYVVMSNWATEFMDTQVIGNINVALVFGLLQFVTTFAARLGLQQVLHGQARPAGREARRRVRRGPALGRRRWEGLT